MSDTVLYARDPGLREISFPGLCVLFAEGCSQPIDEADAALLLQRFPHLVCTEAPVEEVVVAQEAPAPAPTPVPDKPARRGG